jgi:hypothetical protein
MRQVLRAALVSTLALAMWGPSGCGTDAVGVDDCRRLEEARCAAAEACGDVNDIEACQRFYRDQCLHGLSVPRPGGANIDACAQAIASAEGCARETDPACTDPALKEQACELVRHPELAPECSFLGPGDPPGTGGTGSGGGSGMAGESGTAPPSAGAGGLVDPIE